MVKSIDIQSIEKEKHFCIGVKYELVEIRSDSFDFAYVKWSYKRSKRLCIKLFCLLFEVDKILTSVFNCHKCTGAWQNVMKLVD